MSDLDINFSQMKGKLCLNMIVKNESKIIERLLDSVISIIDTYCICDTGSTDNTIQIIREYMNKNGKNGEVYEEPFKNFGYNRTHALNRAERWGEYVLLVDADMTIIITPDFNKSLLNKNGYTVLQRNNSIQYYNTRIIKTGIGAKCIGPTHEYYDVLDGSTKLDTIWINDIGDGGCKSDKFERDIKLLLDGIKEEPNNERYHFYLAQSYNHSGQKLLALEYYKKRVLLGGWIEEVFYAAMEAGNMCRELGMISDAIYWWLEAWNLHPTRAESLYELTKYYREVGKNKLSQIYCDIGKKIPYPVNDLLFIKTAVYQYLFDYEESINAYYTGRLIDHYKYIGLIESGYNKYNVLSNYKYYAKKLIELKDIKEYTYTDKIICNIGGRDDNFTSSTPCIIAHSEGYLMNIRYVNYTIMNDGSYRFKNDDGKITTLNKVYWLNNNMEIIKSHIIDKVENETMRYQGVEDVKIFSHCGEILYLGTVQNPRNDRITIGGGKYALNCDKLISNVYESPNDRICEKNWCYYHNDNGELRVIYEWMPLTIAETNNNTLKILHKNMNMPPIFKDIRGSSNGFHYNDEIWFLCHLVHYSTPRNYYHIIVIFDKKTMEFKRHSILFKFRGDCIEYSLGLVVNKDNIIMSYSCMDRSSHIICIPQNVIEKELFNNIL